MLRSIKSPQRLERRIVVEIDENGGSPQIVMGGEHATITDNGVGDYSVTLLVPAARTLQAQAVCYTAARSVCVTTRSASAVRLVATDLAGVAAESDMCVEIIAMDSEDET